MSADTPDAASLLHTPLHALHLELGARMVPFAGYAMPVQYPAGILAEHRQCRHEAALFDVSHMGQLMLKGPGAAAALETLVPVDVIDLPLNKQRYALFTNAQGGLLDDLMITHREDGLFVIVNAACKDADLAHLREHIGNRCEIVTMFDRALLALQGPMAVHAIARLSPGIEKLTFMTGGFFDVAGVACYVTRSGYTGEDGFEIFVPPQSADRVWQAILQAGQGASVIPCGLGARDTLRLEAGMRLYGNDIDETTTPLEADLGWTVGWAKDCFDSTIGAATLREQKAAGVRRKIVGFEMVDSGIARHGYDVCTGAPGAAPVGKVTSGTQTPYLKKAIGMAYLPVEHTTPGARFDVDIRGRRARARVVPLPFYKRGT
jgi:aminomethyltransferase